MKLIRTASCYLFLLLACFPGTRVSAQQSDNMISLGSWTDASLPTANKNRFSDVWGYARDGKEYALLASRSFIHILDVTDPENIVELHRLNAVLGSASTWRDIKVHGDYAYCVTEASEGLQIIDLTGLPGSASIPYQSREFFSRCHNIFIDTTATPTTLYAFGTQTRRSGYITLDISNPTAPVRRASVNTTGQYIHDGWVGDGVLYANSERRGMYVYDVTNDSFPTEQGILSNYVEWGYNHSVWPTADGQHVVMCDENSDRGVKVVSVSDPSDMEVTSLFRSASLAPNMNSIAHNPYVLGDSLVVLSYYGEGIQIWDITDRNNATRIGYYDTTPNATNYGDGVWGCYPYLPSGNILASDQDNGLFIVRLGGILPVSYHSFTVTADTKAAQLRWSVSEQQDNAGFTVEHAAANGQFADVAWVPAADADYTFTHDDPGAGLHYYRLRQRDFDGTEHYSEVRSVLFGRSKEKFIAYPNPAPAGQVIQLRGADAGAEWEMLSGAGRVVARGKGASLRADLAPGLYFINIEGRGSTSVVISR